MGEMPALTWTAMWPILALTLVVLGVALAALDWLFPRLQRRDRGEVGDVLPGRPLREISVRRREAPLVIAEHRAASTMPAASRAGYWRANLRLIGGILLIWAASAYLPALFAEPLNRVTILTGFPLGYYLGAQGGPLLFLVLALAYAWRMARRDRLVLGAEPDHDRRQTRRRALWLFTGIPGGAALLVLAERYLAFPSNLIGWLLIGLTIGAYLLIGLRNRAATLDDYYVAGRRVPAPFNGLAIAADWMSAATFISLTGTLWLLGYEGLAYIIGWTGGYVLLAVLLAPYLRKFGQYTIPDLFGARFGSATARAVAAVIAMIVSFVYLTAQVSGVGIIMSRFFGVRFILGVGIGLCAVLFCSYLGGMKAITWTQVVQAVVLIVAFLTPVGWMAYRDTGFLLPQLAYGRAFEPIAQLEAAQGIGRSYVEPFNNWTIWNYLALITCLMCGTAGLPHILIRFYTTASVRQARASAGWALAFILVIYLSIPAYAAFARWDILRDMVGQPIAALPNWADTWGAAGLLRISDTNGDGLLQIGELQINPDLIVLATPEMVHLPESVGALTAAGGLAAALSTADGLLLVITSAVAHDIYYSALRQRAQPGDRLRVGRIAMVIAAILAGLTALQQLGIIVEMVAWAFSLAASTMFPGLVLAIFWKRANGIGVVAGMLCGLVVTIAYIGITLFDPSFSILGIASPAAGIFGMPLNFLVAMVVSRLTPPPPPESDTLLEALRRP